MTIFASLALFWLTLFNPPAVLDDGMQSAPPLPEISPAIDMPIRDTSVCLGGDGFYYLTGTTGHPTWWTTNDGLRVWRSKDLQSWEPLGLVWNFEDDATWQKPFDSAGRRAIWAPEIHYLKSTYWIAYSMNYPGGGTGLLKSTTGKPEGPYEDVHPDGPITSGIDASLFEDDDGQVYYVWQEGRIAKMNEAMTDLEGPTMLLAPSNFQHVGFEGAFVFKANNQYHLVCAEFIGHGDDQRYHCVVASSDNLLGPYGERYIAIPHGGHNMVFEDKDGNLRATFFGNDPGAPFRERAAILKVEFDESGKLRPVTGEADTE